jgi:hypothetical protein
VDVANATFQKVKTILRKIVGPHAFVENDQRRVIHKKKSPFWLCEERKAHGSVLVSQLWISLFVE